MDAPLKEKLYNDLKASMKSGEKVKTATIRLVLSAMNNAEIAKQATLTDGDIIVIIGKEIKQRRESIEAFQKGDRQDLIAQEEAEMAVLQSYMPEQVSHEEIVAVAKRIIEEVGAHGAHDKGKVMPKVIGELKGKAEGKEINEVVTELLANIE